MISGGNYFGDWRIIFGKITETGISDKNDYGMPPVIHSLHGRLTHISPVQFGQP